MGRFGHASNGGGGDNTFRLAFGGEIGVVAAEQLHEVVMEALRPDTRHVVVDLAQVSAVQPRGVEVLAHMYERLAADECVLEVRRAPSRVAEILVQAGISLEARPAASDHVTDTEARFLDRGLLGAGGRTERCAAALGAALDFTGADLGNVQLFDRSTGCLGIVSQRGFEEPFLSFFARVDDDRSACGLAMGRGELVAVKNVLTSRVFARTRARRVLIDAGVMAVESMPFFDPSGRFAGVLSVHHRRPGRLSRDRRLRLGLVARRLGDLAGSR